MQEVKITIISSGSASTTQVLKQLIDQGYTIDSHSVEVSSPAAQTKTLITVVHRESSGQWN